MEITTALIAKIVGSVVLVGGGVTGIYFGQDYLNNSLSRYDKALMDFLNGNGNDIIFEVKKGENGNEDLTATDFSASIPTNPITIRVRTNTSNASLKTNGSTPNETDLKGIKALNKTESNGWTWECPFKFEGVGEVNGKSIKEEYKNRIFKDTNLGLFGLLKKDLSSYTNATPADKNKWTKEEIKQVKIDFIKKCGWERKITKNRTLNKEKVEDSEIKVGDISIKFKANGNDLIPENTATFDYWFINTNKLYHTVS